MKLPDEFTLEQGGRLYRAEIFKPTHLPEVVELEERCFSDPWTESLLLQESEEVARRWNLVLVGEEGLVGYSFVWTMEDELHLLNFAVRPELQRRGIGRAYLRRLIGESRRAGFKLMSLEVRESNEPAIQLYRGVGMVVLLKREGYYHETGEDALVMVLPLQGSGEEEP